MLAIERRNAILEKLQTEKRVVVGELSEMYHVSEETIRRDLDKLENDGYAIKSYGGAVLNENSNFELPFNVRKNRNVLGKQKIASLIGGMVNDGENIILDASSTAGTIAKVLKDKKNITIITNSLEISIELMEYPNCRVITTGGETSSKYFALVGPLTDRAIRAYYADRAIISAKGLDMDAGFTDSEDRHANNKLTMLQCAKQKILAVDSSKFDKIAFCKVGDLQDIDMIVTDKKPDDGWLRELKERNVECVYPE